MFCSAAGFKGYKILRPNSRLKFLLQANMAAERSWVHSMFWPKRMGAGDDRFCKLCFAEEDEQPSVDQVRQLIDAGFAPSGAFRGCVLNKDTPSAMMNHVRAKHPQHLPEYVQEDRTQGSPHKKRKLDRDLLASWAEHVVLGALREVDFIDDPHVRAVLEPRLPGLGHEDSLQKEVDACVGRIRSEVRRKIAEAKAGKAKFCLSADSWKPKMRLRRSYVAVYLHWINADWEAEAVCCGVRETFPPRTGESYKEHFVLCLESVDLKPCDISCGLSDHEGAIRLVFVF